MCGCRHNPPRVLYIITRSEKGGAQTHVLDLAKAMCNTFDVAVAAGENGFLVSACQDANIPVYVLPHLRRRISPVADIRALWEICKAIRSFQPDLVHAHTSKAGILGRLAGRLLGVPSIYTMHGAHFEEPTTSRLSKFVEIRCERIASKWSARQISVCHEGERLATSHRIGNPSTLVTIHNGIEDNCEWAALTPDHPPVITMTARFRAPKDHNLLLRAFSIIPPGPRLRLIGGGPLRASCEKLVHELGIDNRVEFLGECDDVASLLATSDVYVLATNSEMLPISILEAMRAGLPAIASRVGGVTELVRDGETGLLVRCGSVLDLAQALTRVIEDFDYRFRLGRAARRLFTAEFLLARQVERTRALYWEVIQASAQREISKRNTNQPSAASHSVG